MKRGACVVVCLLGALAVLASFGACSSDDTGPASNGAVDAASDAAMYGTSPCAACVDAACSAEKAACAGEPSCATWLACVAACPVSSDGSVDDACLGACPLPSTSEGEALREPYSSCATLAEASCGACGAVDGGGGDASGVCVPKADQCPSVVEADVCLKCMKESCCDWMDAVSKVGGTGYALTLCVNDCNFDQACFDQCFVDHPEGVPSWGAFTACHQTNCDPDFGCANDDDCGRCMYRECGCEYQNCLADPQCFLAFRCIQKCNPTDVSCVPACVAQYPGAEVYTEPLSTCIGNRCLTICAG